MTISKDTFPKLAMFIAYGKSFTGGPRVVVNLSDGLRAKGFDLRVLTNRNSEMTNELQELGIAYKILSGSADLDQGQGRVLKQLTRYPRAAVSLLALWMQVMRVCRQEKIRVMWVRNLKGVLLVGVPSRIAGCRLVWDIGMEYPARGLFFILHTLGLLVSHRIVAEGSSVFRKTFTRLQRSIFGKKMVTIKSAIPEETRGRIEKAKERHLCEVGQESKSPVVIIYPASIQPRKNQKQLLDALGHLSATCPDLSQRIECRFVGPVASRPYYDELMEQLSNSPFREQVKFLGWRDDVPELLAESSIFCLLSKNEGVPYSILEAMHASLPIVVSDAGGIPDVVESGRNGLIVDCESPERTADAIKKVVEDPDLQLQLSMAAKAYVEASHSRQGWINQYSELLGALSS